MAVVKQKSNHPARPLTVDDLASINDLSNRYRYNHDADPRAEWAQDDSEEESAEERDLTHIAEADLMEVTE